MGMAVDQPQTLVLVHESFDYFAAGDSMRGNKTFGPFTW
jgi:hypothetical protein